MEQERFEGRQDFYTNWIVAKNLLSKWGGIQE